MKKLCMIMALIMAVCLSAGAQIRNDFFGYKIGTTTLDKARKTIEKKGFKQSQFSDKEFKAYDLEYDGQRWDVVELKFNSTFDNPETDILIEANFYRMEYIAVEYTEEDSEYVNPDEAAEQMAEIEAFGKITADKLRKRYSQLITHDYATQDDYSNPLCFSFEDDKIDGFFCVSPTAGGFGYMPYTAQVRYELKY